MEQKAPKMVHWHRKTAAKSQVRAGRPRCDVDPAMCGRDGALGQRLLDELKQLLGLAKT